MEIVISLIWKNIVCFLLIGVLASVVNVIDKKIIRRNR